jgi:hypothetical protein
MSNYTKTTNFAAKDSLPSGNANKIVKGTEIDTEFDNIATASATKADIAGPTFTGTVTIPTVDLNGGAIDGTTVGASTAAAITGTTIVANTSINIAGDGATVTGIKDEDDMSSNSATKLATQQSIKAYVDSQVTAQDLDFQADSGGALSIDLDSETLTFTGGTGVDTSGSGNAVTFAIDSTVATLTGTQTLTNKTLTSPTLNTPTIGTSFTIGSATITEAELEILDGATVTTAELNVLDGITSTTAELNILDGVTSTAAELNILDGVTSTAAELNILDGVTATTAELNIMDGVTATTAELNYVDGVTSNVQTQLDAKAPIASPTFTGTVTVPGLTTSADILFADNDKAIFGAGSDLQIYHNGSHSYISDQGTGDLRLLAGDFRVRNAADDETMIQANVDGDVSLWYNNSKKLATNNTGIDVTGVITTDGMTTSADINFGDSDKAVFGAGSDLQIYHDGSGNHSYITESGTGDFFIQGNNLIIENTGGENYFRAVNGGAVQLYYSGSEKLATTSTGIDVTGTVTADGFQTDTSNTSFNLLARNSTNTAVYAQNGGTGAVFEARSGSMSAGQGDVHLKVDNNGDISFYEDTGTNARVVWDSSAETFAIGNIQGSAEGTLKVKSDSNHRGLVIEENNGQEVYQLGVVADGSLVFQNSGSEVVRFDDSGNVGIGTSSPDRIFHVSRSSASVISGKFESASTSGSHIVFKDADTTTNDLQVRIGSDANDLVQYAGGSERLRIDSSGNVGIGTSSPTALIHLSSTAPSILMQDSDGTGRTSINCDNGSLNFKFNSNNAVGTSVLTFSDYNTERMRIDSSGNVEVKGGQELRVYRTDNATYGSIKYLTGSGGLQLNDKNGDGISFVKADGTTEYGRFDSSGNLLVGTTSVINTGKVSVVFTGASGNGISLKTTTASNGSKFLSFANSGGTEIGYIEENTNTSVNYSTSSDQRLKENIADADDAGSKVDAIQVRKFDWIADGSHQDYGMVAQELQTVAPEAVSGDADSEDMMGVDYSKLVPMLVKEIQSLRARVAQLETN